MSKTDEFEICELQLPCVLRRPVVPMTAEPAPLLLFLHGFDEAAPMDLRQVLTKHGPLRPGSSRCTEQFLVMAPQLRIKGDVWHRYADAVREMVEGIEAQHAIDPARRYLTGFSYGANGVFDLGLAQPGMWAALWAVDPTRVPTADPQSPVWLSSGERSRDHKADFISRLALEPIAVGHSGDRVYVDDGQDHVGTATCAYRDDRIYQWLLSKKLA